jgi:hypothetical protein
MSTVFPTPPSSVGMRDALLLLIPVGEGTDEKLLHSLTLCMYI